MKKTNKRSLVITAFLAFLLLIAGTFAWTSFSQRALNEANGNEDQEEEFAGGRIHDDYNKTSGNKDIYGENYGDEDLFVRIQLSEYFEKGGTPLVAGTEKANRNTWTPYVLPETTEPTNAYRTYITWELGGNKNFLPTFNTNSDDLTTDASGDAIDFIQDGQTALGSGEHDFFSFGEAIANPDDATQIHTVKATLTQKNAPISMAAWKVLPAEDKAGDFWVIDTDGWAYWANKLKPTESTSLLLNKINLDGTTLTSLDEEWYYGIDVIGEFVNELDKDEFTNSEHGAPSDDAQNLLNNLTKDPEPEPEPEVFTYAVEFTSDVTAIEMNAETSQKFSAKVVKTDKDENKTDVASTLVWSISPDTSFASVDETGLVTVERPDQETVVTVKVASAEYKVENSFDISVKPAKQFEVGEEFDFYGEEYIHLKDLGAGNHLVLRKFLLRTEQNQTTTIAYNGSMLDKNMREYYAGLSAEAKAAVQPVQATFALGMGDKDAFGLDKQKFLMSQPAQDFAAVTASGEKKAFALSAAEVNDVSGVGKAFPTVSSRLGYHQPPYKQADSWWLRTPSFISQPNSTHSFVWSVSVIDGTFSNINIVDKHAIRPALIIHQD